MARDWLRSLVLAFGLLVACRQISLHGGYSPNAVYRAQVDALLDGRLALTTAPEGLVHDLAWTPSGVQQVWGLGAPLWQLPFEVAGRIAGLSPVPDRIALAAWLAVMIFVVLRAFRPRELGEPRPPALDDQRSTGGLTRAIDSRAMQIGALLLTALLPALVTVLRGRIGVYEEAAIYAYGAAMILLGGLIVLRRKPTTARYLVLLAFAGATGLVRPTVWFYGLATALVASVLVVRVRGRGALRVIALGWALFVAGGGALYATNAVRFGRGSEFGHRLNVHSLPGNLVATRFGYPFERAGALEAAKELFAGLFDGPERRSRRGFYQKALHHWQSPLPRWREYYFTTYSWPYLPAIVAGAVLGAIAWRRRGDPFARTLGAWAVLGGGPLLVFYLHSPSVSSRYQLDLAPAAAALLVISWRACAARWPRRALAVLAILWATAVVTSKTTRPAAVSDPVDRDTAARTMYELTRPVVFDRALPAAYDRADPFLPAWTETSDDQVRCSDAFGAELSCDAPTLPGDIAVSSQRSGRAWLVDRYTIPDAPLAPICRSIGDDGSRDAGADGQLESANAPGAPDLPGAGDTARGASAGSSDAGSRICSAEISVQRDPAAVHDLALVAPPPLYLNGFGWDLATARVPPATLFYVDDPAYIALDVTGPPDTDWERAVRVAVGLEHLRLIAVAETPAGARLRFEGGRHPGLVIAFVAFGPDTAMDQPQSAFGLRSIRWRD